MAFEIIKHHGSYNVVASTVAKKYIVIHYTGGTGSAKNNCVYFSGGNRSASAHYFIDSTSIYEFADPKTKTTWHCGDGGGKYGITNANSIGIEVVMDGNKPFTAAEIERLTWLVQKLMKDFGISASNVVRHYDASRKMCPLYYASNGDKWKELKAKITGGNASTPATKPSAPAPKPPASTSKPSTSTNNANLSVDGLWGQGTTKAIQKYLGTVQDGIVSKQSAGDLAKTNKGGLLSSSWKTGSGGSLMVKALQKKVGVKADGYFGPNTCKALQKHLGTVQDGIVSKPSAMVKELQRRLNAGKF